MMSIRNIRRTIIIGVASIVLVLPLVMNNSINNVASAKVRTHRVAKIHYRTTHHYKHHVHYYYKFAYNKKEYRIYLKAEHDFYKNNAKTEKKFHINKYPVAYRKGFIDSLSNNFNNSLKHNKNYCKGSIIGMIASDDNKVTKKNIKSNANYYDKILMKYDGYATAPALDQMKNEAHIGTL